MYAGVFTPKKNKPVCMRSGELELHYQFMNVFVRKAVARRKLQLKQIAVSLLNWVPQFVMGELVLFDPGHKHLDLQKIPD